MGSQGAAGRQRGTERGWLGLGIATLLGVVAGATLFPRKARGGESDADRIRPAEPRASREAP